MTTTEIKEEVKEKEKSAEVKEEKEVVKQIIIRAYPKSTVLIWILAWISLIFGILELLFATSQTVMYALGLVYIVILLFLLFVISFEFTRGKTISIVLLVVVVILIILLLGRLEYIAPGVILEWIFSLQIAISWQAYIAISIGCFFILFLIWLSRRFDYWIFEPNQIIHKQEPFGTSTRYPTTNVRYKTEIRDLFEYILFFGAGILVVHIPAAGRSFEFSLVPRIKNVDKELSKLFGYIEVE